MPAAFLVAVWVTALSRAISGHPTVHAFALTPDRLAHGELWLFPTSALIANGPVLPQLIVLVPTVVAAVWLLGARLTAIVMIACHVGATLLAYGTLALFTGDADGAHNRDLDYGVSAVWLGLLGAMVVPLLPRARRGELWARIALATTAATAIAGVTMFPLLASTEHGLAFALGLLIATARCSAARRSARSSASTASARAGAA